jgi:hypothetical protein
MKINFEPRHLLKKAKNEFEIPCPLQRVFNKENSVISILKTTTTIPYDVGNEAFYKTFLLSFLNQTSKTISNRIKEEGGRGPPASPLCEW